MDLVAPGRSDCIGRHPLAWTNPLADNRRNQNLELTQQPGHLRSAMDTSTQLSLRRILAAARRAGLSRSAAPQFSATVRTSSLYGPVAQTSGAGGRHRQIRPAAPAPCSRAGACICPQRLRSGVHRSLAHQRLRIDATLTPSGPVRRDRLRVAGCRQPSAGLAGMPTHFQALAAKKRFQPRAASAQQSRPPPRASYSFHCAVINSSSRLKQPSSRSRARRSGAHGPGPPGSPANSGPGASPSGH